MNEGKRILVVEDDSDLRELLVELLAAEGYAVAGAGTGDEAIREIRKQVPDLLVVDILLPDISGLEISRGLRDCGADSLPVYFISGKTDLETRLRCFLSGGTRFIPKPFEPDFLLETIESELRHHAA